MRTTSSKAARGERLDLAQDVARRAGSGSRPRAIGTMQNVQKRSQPSCTLRKARVWPANVRAPNVATAVSRRLLPDLDARDAPAAAAVAASTRASSRLRPMT